MEKKPSEGKLGAGKPGGSSGKEEMMSHVKKMYQRKKKGRGEAMTQETRGKQARGRRSLGRRGRWRRSEKGMVSRMARRTRGPSGQGCRLGGAPGAPREPAAVLGAGAGGSGRASGPWRQASRRGGGTPSLHDRGAQARTPRLSTEVTSPSLQEGHRSQQGAEGRVFLEGNGWNPGDEARPGPRTVPGLGRKVGRPVSPRGKGQSAVGGTCAHPVLADDL